MYQTKWTEKLYLGTRREDRTRMYLLAPKWRYNQFWGWGWGFGDVENKKGQNQLINCMNGIHTDWVKALRKEYKLNVKIEGENLEKFCDLAKMAYTLKEAAHIYEVGLLHHSRNAIIHVIVNDDEVKRLNKVVLPKIFDEIYELLTIGQSWETFWRVDFKAKKPLDN